MNLKTDYHSSLSFSNELSWIENVAETPKMDCEHSEIITPLIQKNTAVTLFKEVFSRGPVIRIFCLSY